LRSFNSSGHTASDKVFCIVHKNVFLSARKADLKKGFQHLVVVVVVVCTPESKVLVVFNSSVPVSTPLPVPFPLPFRSQVGNFGRKRELSGS
jgi:hypothetical protein